MEPLRITFPTLILSFVLPALAVGCSDDGELRGPNPEVLGKVSAELTKAERITRYEKIKAAAAKRGINNTAYLLAGIAYAETGLAHCWSEATWACQGPNSSDCGGPVIAGAGDGPCSLKQGGLGMFQFDAGTFTDTLNKYGNNVLTIAGNVDHAINYVINMVKNSTYTTNAETDAKALQWVANYNYNNSTQRDQWIKTVTHYYNGCKPSYSCWSQRYKHYNDSLSFVVNETGLDFWKTAAAQQPNWKASFVSQSFPYASQPFEIAAGSTKDGYIELKNEGKATWKPGEVFLGTTEPRDKKSAIAAPGWVNDHRAATVAKETPPGAVGRFNFAVKAPSKPGDYPQFFNLVREGVAWFSDNGQGGPPDNQLQVRVTSVAVPCPAGVGASWVCQGQSRVKCDPSNGIVTKEACANGCEDAAGGAQCSVPANQGGAGGAGDSGSGGDSGDSGQGGAEDGAGGDAGGAGGEEAADGGEGGSENLGESSGKAGAGGAGVVAGSAGVGGALLGGASGKGGEKPSQVLFEHEEAPDEGCGCTIPGHKDREARGALGLLLGLGLLFRRGRRATNKTRV